MLLNGRHELMQSDDFVFSYHYIFVGAGYFRFPFSIVVTSMNSKKQHYRKLIEIGKGSEFGKRECMMQDE